MNLMPNSTKAVIWIRLILSLYRTIKGIVWPTFRAGLCRPYVRGNIWEATASHIFSFSFFPKHASCHACLLNNRDLSQTYNLFRPKQWDPGFVAFVQPLAISLKSKAIHTEGNKTVCIWETIQSNYLRNQMARSCQPVNHIITASPVATYHLARHNSSIAW